MLEITQDDIMKFWNPQYVTPIVSIRCLTYNQKAFIGQALDSMLIQKTNFPFIIIVHDDASTDGTSEVIKEYEKKYPQIIKPIYEKENQYSKKDGSLMRIMNNASCNSKYCASCEGDDYWIDENKLQIQVDFLEKHQEFSACTHNVKYIKVNRFFKKEGLMYPAKECILTTENFSEICHVNSLVYRTEVLREWPEFAYRKGTAGDVKLNALLKLRGPIFRFNKVMSVYRKGVAGSWVRRVSRNPDAMTNQTKKTKEFFTELMNSSPENFRLHFLKQLDWLDFRILKNSLQLSLAKKKYPKYWNMMSFKEKIHLHCNWILNKLRK